MELRRHKAFYGLVGGRTIGDVFQLRTTRQPPDWPKTINLFLFAPAKAMGRRVVAVILSGPDGAGSEALKAIIAEKLNPWLPSLRLAGI
jgi:hypothetical protein